MRRKQNLGLKVTQQSWLSLSLLPSLFTFLASFFFSLAGHLVGFNLVERVFRKAFRILGLGERKGRWVMEQDFHGDFQVNVTWFFASFSGVLDWMVLILVWFERSLHSAQVSEESCPWPLKLMTSQRVERTWIRTGGYGRFRGEWVKYGTRLSVVYAKWHWSFWYQIANVSWLSARKNITLCLAMTARPVLRPKYWILRQLLKLTKLESVLFM